jgi:hypothetical protein
MTSPIFFPKYFSQKAIQSFIAVLVICTLIFFNRRLGLEWIFFDLCAVIGFFVFANLLSKNWAKHTTQLYEKKLFITALFIRIVWVIFSYWYFIYATGQPFEYGAADAVGYHGEAQWLASILADGKFEVYQKYIGLNFADMGYPTYLGTLAYFTGDNILIPRVLKAIWGTLTCLLIYRIAKNNFGEPVGRMAGIFAMLMPNLVYYTGLHVKETEMVTIVVSFAYFGDKILRAPKIQFLDFIWLGLLGGALFLFRTVLAVSLIASVGISLFFVARRVTSAGRRLGLFALGIIGLSMILSGPLQGTILKYVEESDTNLDRQMLSYSKYTANTNKLAQYGSKSIFLPLMLVAPFPTLVDTDQPTPMMLGGTFFTRNVYAFFVFLAIISLYKRKTIRAHIFLLSCLFFYLIVLGTTGFALSERFHMPALPFLIIFAAYGVSQVNQNNKKYFIPYLFFIGLIVIGWNWFKVAGRA